MTRFLVSVALAGIVLLAAACAEPPTAVLRVGVSPWVGGDPLVFAGAQRILDPRLARVVELGSSSESLRALRNGVLEGAVLRLDEALRLADEGVALKIVAVLNVSRGGDAVLAQPPLYQPEDLKGRLIAAEQSAGGGLMLARLMEAGGLNPSDVDIVRVEAIDHQGVFGGARVDAVVTYEPIKSRLQNAGYRVIFDSHSLPGQIVDVLVMASHVVERRPDDVASVIVAWGHGLEAFGSEREEVANLMAAGAGLSAPDYRAALDGLRFVSLADSARLLSGQPAPLVARAAELEAFMLGQGVLRVPPDWVNLIVPGPATRALRNPDEAE